MGKEAKENSLKVKIFWKPDAEQKNFEGKVEAISSQNQLGKFDILPGHANFITFIFQELILYFKNKEKTSFHFERGILEVSENEVNIFLGV